MLRFLSLLCCIVMIFCIVIPVSAAGTDTQMDVVSCQEVDLGNGITAIDVLTVNTNSRLSERTAGRTRTIKYGDTTVGVISIQATFRFTGNSVYVASKSVTRTDTYEGWTYEQNSFIAAGGSVILDAKLTKLLVFNLPFTLTITCDENGNIS